jgi:hypothetical protein
MPLPMKTATARNLLIAAVVVASGGVAVAGPAPTAEAESGFRVCGVYNSSNIPSSGGVGTGLVVKVSKSGGDTCKRKIAEMERRYAAAYPGSSAKYNYRMLTCEAWMTRMAFPYSDYCPSMEKDAVYKIASPADALHPVEEPHLEKLG